MRVHSFASPGSVPMAAALALLVMLAGCGGGSKSKPTPVPPGFTVYRGPDFELAYPTGWGKVTKKPSVTGSGTYYQVLGPGPQDGLPPQVGLGRGRANGHFKTVVELNKTAEKATSTQWRLVDEHDVAVTGAKDAHLIETTYLLPLKTGTSVRTREIQLLVRTAHGTQMDLLVRAPAAQFNSLPLRKVVSAFRVR